MRWLSDKTLDHLRTLAGQPDLTSTKYRLLGEIGRGGMGTVYLVQDEVLNRQVALKVLNIPELSEEAASRLLREARILAQLEHPEIVPMHDAGRLPDGRVFYVMKRVRGRRLDEYRQEATSRADLLRIFEKLCEAVAFGHANGVIHRDLKPENIMVGSFGEVLVMDWGVAKVLAEQDSPGPVAVSEPAAPPAATAPGTVLGTPAYMAPEQARGEVERVREPSDVYALGAILHFLLTGRAPAEPGATSPVRALGAVCRKATAADAALRYPSAKELGAEVARFLNGLPVLAYKEGVFERTARVVRQNRTAVILVLAYLLMRSLILFFAGR